MAIPLAEQARIPDLMQIGVVVASVTKLKVVASSIVPIRDVHGLMEVLDQMDEEAKRHPAPGPRGMRIGQDRSELGDLGDDTSLRPAVTGTVMRRRDRHVDEVPGSAAGNLAAVLVGPGGRVRQRFSRFEQVANDCAGLRRKPRLGESGRGTMTHPAPGQGRSRQAKKQRAGDQEDEPGTEPRPRPASQSAGSARGNVVWFQGVWPGDVSS